NEYQKPSDNSDEENTHEEENVSEEENTSNVDQAQDDEQCDEVVSLTPQYINARQKHIMLSYQWENQDLVEQVYQFLTANDFSVWMDINGGMKANIYECMAEGVENAAAICCFMSPKYEKSENCQQELQFAKTKRVPIIPCKLQRNWEPSGWLAGLLWMDFRDINNSNFEKKAKKLMDQINVVLGQQDVL
ncbi:unnamed protein product, partial [Didymodactylos carnosus]